MTSLPVLGEEINKEEWSLAVNVLKGKDNTRDKAWAVQRLEQSLTEEKDAYVLNVLGIAYLHGIGTEQDTVKAVTCFEESGEMGYVLSYHNLGMMYKYATGVKQNFQKSFEAFQKGATFGDPSNSYNCGFMYYKGLGCEQNYAEAVELFRRAANYDHAPSLFMLGLCYRNGYGVEADTAIGNTYLRQSAALGQPDAMEELLNEEPENTMVRAHAATLDESITVPEEMPSIVPYLPQNNSQEVAGQYQGVIVTYDWSGKNIIEEKPLAVDLTVQGDSASGLWEQGLDTIPFTARLTPEGVLHFGDVTAQLYDRYALSGRSTYRFDKADFNYQTGTLTGQLRLYSLSEMEPERPMYVCLLKATGAELSDEEIRNSLKAYSSPTTDQVILKFTLAEDVPAVRISFFSRTGLNVQNFTYGYLPAGECTLTLSPSLADGAYTIRVLAGNQQYQTLIVK
jgi:TPR repeat protein